MRDPALNNSANYSCRQAYDGYHDPGREYPDYNSGYANDHAVYNNHSNSGGYTYATDLFSYHYDGNGCTYGHSNNYGYGQYDGYNQYDHSNDDYYPDEHHGAGTSYLGFNYADVDNAWSSDDDW